MSFSSVFIDAHKYNNVCIYFQCTRWLATVLEIDARWPWQQESADGFWIRRQMAALIGINRLVPELVSRWLWRQESADGQNYSCYIRRQTAESLGVSRLVPELVGRWPWRQASADGLHDSCKIGRKTAESISVSQVSSWTRRQVAMAADRQNDSSKIRRQMASALVTGVTCPCGRIHRWARPSSSSRPGSPGSSASARLHNAQIQGIRFFIVISGVEPEPQRNRNILPQRYRNAFRIRFRFRHKKVKKKKKKNKMATIWATMLLRSQHPPTQWNLRGGRWSSVE